MMDQRTIKAFLLFVALFWVSSATYANSTKHRKKLWNLNSISGPIKSDSNFLYYFEWQNRLRDVGPMFEEQIFRPFLGYQLNPSMSVWLGYAYFISISTSSKRRYENRITEQFIWKAYEHNHYQISSRTRLEQRHVNTSPNCAYRLRESVRIIFPRLKFLAVHPMIWNEVFLNLNRPGWLSQNRTLNQNRFFIGLRFIAGKHVHIELGYMNQYIPRITSNIDNHILFIGIKYHTG